jgi:hypothetical protein
MKSGLNLNKKAVLVTAGILFFIIAINTGVLTLVATEKYKKAILSKTEAVGEGLQRDLGKVLGLGVPIESLEGVNEKMQEFLARDKAIGYAMVLDKDGKVLFHNDTGQNGKTLTDSATAKALSSDQTLLRHLLPSAQCRREVRGDFQGGRQDGSNQGATIYAPPMGPRYFAALLHRFDRTRLFFDFEVHYAAHPHNGKNRRQDRFRRSHRGGGREGGR